MRISFVLLILLPWFAFAQFENKKEYHINKCNTAPKIDGVLDDQVWNNNNKADEFVQLTPNNGAQERKDLQTEVQICYDDHALYFGIMMYDAHPDSILKELSKRDEDGKNFDWFGIWIDPYNNGALQYNFLVSAAGVQTDAKYTNTSIDLAWDAVWKSGVKINKQGWVAEFAIPFSTLRFPAENKKWSLNMCRSIRRYREDYTWNFIDINYENYAAQQGLLVFEHFDITSPIRLSFMPYSALYYNNFDGDITYPYNMGMDLKYGISESFTLDMTLIPDFGQVAPDDKVLNLSPFEIKYSEKRQFFTEGTELFDKAGNLFYTRRVSNNLLNATKITGRNAKGLGIGVLNALNKDLNNANILIFDQSLKNNSSLALINTNNLIKDIGITSNVTAINTTINNKENSRRYTAFFATSNVQEEQNTTGFLGNFAIEKTKGSYKYALESGFADHRFNTNELGYLPRNNFIKNAVELSYNQLTPNKYLINSNFTFSSTYQSLYTKNAFENISLALHSMATLKNYLTVGFFSDIYPVEKIDYFEARTLDGGMTADLESPFISSKKISGHFFASSDYRKKLALDFSFGSSWAPLYSTKSLNWRLSPMIRINDKLSLRYVLSTEWTKNDAGFATNDTLGNPIFALRNVRMITNVLSGSYVISNKIDLSFKLRYHFDQVENTQFKNLTKEGYLKDSFFYDNENINYTIWTANLQCNWWFAPGSQISLVWNQTISNYDQLMRNHWTENVEHSFSLPQENSLSMKIIYYLDYLYLRK